MPITCRDPWRADTAAKICACTIFLALAACASPPPPQSLTAAERTVSETRSDPQVQRLAPDALNNAEQALNRAQSSWKEGKSKEEIDHLAYLTERRAAIAKATANAKSADEEFADLTQQREQIRLEATKQRAEQAESEVERLQRELKAERTSRGLVVTLSGLLFDVDSADLKPGGMQNVSQVAEFLRDNPDRKALIEGHTDSTGSANYNLNLSKSRAEAVGNFLVTQGVDPNRIVTRGYGEMFPVATNATSAGRQQNRRVEIVILNAGAPVPPARVSQRQPIQGPGPS